MKAITVNGKEYKLEFTFEAAEHRDLVQKMFEILSGSYLFRNSKISDMDKDSKERMIGDMVDGTSAMVAEIPHICLVAFYAGLLENNPLPEGEAKKVMRAYMKENKISYSKLYEEIKNCMEDDGFFELSGLTDMVNQMNGTEKKAVKTPQDHKKKSTSTK